MSRVGKHTDKVEKSLGLEIPSHSVTEELKTLTVPDNVVIRQMEVRDAGQVYHLGETVFNSSGFPQLYRTWDPFAVTETLAADPDLCLVAEEVPPDVDADDDLSLSSSRIQRPRGRVVGFILASITEKRKKEQNCGYLSWVAVAKSHQRRKIGTLLAMRAFNLFVEEDIHTVIVDTPRENMPAIRFLEGLGFGMPVYHVYMSLNISKGVKPAQPIVAGEAKSVKLRHMTIDDLSLVYELGELVYSEQDYPNLFRIWSESEVVELFGSDSDTCLVAEKDGKVVGFVLGTTIEKKRNSWRYGYLIWLGVAPEVQRLGVGRRLFCAFYDLMVKEGARIILADTQADNEPARRFFQRAGFGSEESHVYFSKPLTTADVGDGDGDDITLEDTSRMGSASAMGGGSKLTSKVLRMFKRPGPGVRDLLESSSSSSSSGGSTTGGGSGGKRGGKHRRARRVVPGPSSPAGTATSRSSRSSFSSSLSAVPQKAKKGEEEVTTGRGPTIGTRRSKRVAVTKEKDAGGPARKKCK